MEQAGSAYAPKRKLTTAALTAAPLSDGDIIDVEDEVYRIFNMVRFEKEGKQRMSRDIVLGSMGNGVRTVLWDKSAEFADTGQVQRRDKVLITNLKVKKEEDETVLHSSITTSISRINPARSAITDFGLLKGDERSADISGRIVSIGAKKLFKGLGGKENGVADCTISDGTRSIRVALWGACSAFIGTMHPGEYLKVEFVAMRSTENGIEASANDSSRLLLSKIAL